MALVNQGGALVKRGESLGSGQACCCPTGGDDCCTYTPLPAGYTPSVSVTVTIPETEGASCLAGEYTGSANLVWSNLYGYYQRCVALDGPTEGTSAIVYFICFTDGRYITQVFFYAGSNCSGYVCTIGEGGGSIGVGPTEDQVGYHETRYINGACIPDSGSGSYTSADTGVLVSWTVTV